MMGLFKKYIQYLKDNPERYWFKRKLYGWGWTPATWEGWLATAIFIGTLVWHALRIDAGLDSAHDTLRSVLILVLILFLFICLCVKKGESPRFQWGIPKEKNDIDD